MSLIRSIQSSSYRGVTGINRGAALTVAMNVACALVWASAATAEIPQRDWVAVSRGATAVVVARPGDPRIVIRPDKRRVHVAADVTQPSIPRVEEEPGYRVGLLLPLTIEDVAKSDGYVGDGGPVFLFMPEGLQRELVGIEAGTKYVFFLSQPVWSSWAPSSAPQEEDFKGAVILRRPPSSPETVTAGACYSLIGNQHWGRAGWFELTPDNEQQASQILSQIRASTIPSVAITSPASGGTLSGSATITAQATDDVNIPSVQFLLDDRPVGSPVVHPPYEIALETTLFANGSHVLSAVASDAVGNSGTAPPLTVSVANGPAIRATPACTTSAAMVTLSVSRGPGNAGDWVGVFAGGAGDSGYVDWWYLNGTRTRPAAGLSNTSFGVSPGNAPAGTYEFRLFNSVTGTVVAVSNTVSKAATCPP